MKQGLVSAAMLLNGFFYTNQSICQNQSSGNVIPFSGTSSPAQFTNEIFRFQPGLATHYFTGNLPSGTPNAYTGFEAGDRWLSFGQVSGGPSGQVLQGFRTQTDGKGLAWGHSIPSSGSVSNPFIEWIGNNSSSPTSAPGNLEFKYAANSTGASGARVPIFTMAPSFTVAGVTTPSFNYAEADAFVGQLQSGAFGSFGSGDRWSATGQITIPSVLTSYGSRHQYEGYTVNTGLLKIGTNINSIMDFGSDATAGLATNVFKFRAFTDPNSSSSIKNVWQSGDNYGNVVFGRQDYNSVASSSFYASVFDGVASAASSTSLNFIQKAGLYVTGDGLDQNNSGSQLSSYAAVVGDVSGVSLVNSGSDRYAILGIAEANYTPNTSNNNRWAGYFIGRVGYTGSLTPISDQKFKKDINDEENILPKLMQLQPKNYLFDVEKYKSMAFSDRLQHGLISQEVEKVFPELVEDAFGPNTSSDKKQDGKPVAYKGLNYMGLISMLLKGIQEQQVQIDELKNKLETATSNTLVVTNKNSLPTEIQNKAFALSQNVPNPFSENTTISYTIPANTGKAILAIFDLNGRMLLQYPLAQGKNTIEVKGNTLSAGMYLYSLIADGQEVLSKRMVLTK